MPGRVSLQSHWNRSRQGRFWSPRYAREPEAPFSPFNPAGSLASHAYRKKNEHQGQVPTPRESVGSRLTHGSRWSQL